MLKINEVKEIDNLQFHLMDGTKLLVKNPKIIKKNLFIDHNYDWTIFTEYSLGFIMPDLTNVNRKYKEFSFIMNGIQYHNIDPFVNELPSPDIKNIALINNLDYTLDKPLNIQTPEAKIQMINHYLTRFSDKSFEQNMVKYKNKLNELLLLN